MIFLCEGPSCGRRLPPELVAAFEDLADDRGFELQRRDCTGACPVGPNALADDGSGQHRKEQTLLTGLIDAVYFERLLDQLVEAHACGETPATLVGARPMIGVQRSKGTPA